MKLKSIHAEPTLHGGDILEFRDISFRPSDIVAVLKINESQTKIYLSYGVNFILDISFDEICELAGL